MKITKGTIVRLVLVALVILNEVLKALGVNTVTVDENAILFWVETIIEIAVIVVAAWKNNSVTPAAIKADEFLKQLREEDSSSII